MTANTFIDLRMFENKMFSNLGWEFIGDENHAIGYFRWNEKYHYWPEVVTWNTLPESVRVWFAKKFAHHDFQDSNFIYRLSLENVEELIEVINENSEQEDQFFFAKILSDMLRTVNMYKWDSDDGSELEIWFNFHS